MARPWDGVPRTRCELGLRDAGILLRDPLLKAMLRLDPLEAAALVERVRALPGDARAHAKNSAAVGSGPGLGRLHQGRANAVSTLVVGYDQAKDFSRRVTLEARLRSDVDPADRVPFRIGNEETLILPAVD